MKIKSKFKDYYDFIAHAYGGGDPKFVYTRSPISDDLLTVEVRCSQPLESYYSVRRLDNLLIQHKNLVIADKSYLILSKRANINDKFSDYKIFTQQDFPEEYELLVKRSFKYEDYVGNKWPALVDISRQIKQPVFMINRIERLINDRYRVIIDKRIPILDEYGIASLIPPEQIYQDISYYYSNLMHTSPDLAVIDSMTDKEKISQHGFDLKQSFRHRK